MLLISAAIYGSVAVAPRLSAWIDIRHDYITNAHQLKALETEVDYLERVRDALQSDPEFVQRLASASIAKETGHGEMIPVSGSLIFGSEDQLYERMPEIAPLMGSAVVQVLARDHRLRSSLLVVAGVLVIFAFTVLNGSGGWFVSTTAALAVAAVRIPRARYGRVADAEQSDV